MACWDGTRVVGECDSAANGPSQNTVPGLMRAAGLGTDGGHVLAHFAGNRRGTDGVAVGAVQMSATPTNGADDQREGGCIAGYDKRAVSAVGR